MARIKIDDILEQYRPGEPCGPNILRAFAQMEFSESLARERNGQQPKSLTCLSRHHRIGKRVFEIVVASHATDQHVSHFAHTLERPQTFRIHVGIETAVNVQEEQSYDICAEDLLRIAVVPAEKPWKPLFDEL